MVTFSLRYKYQLSPLQPLIMTTKLSPSIESTVLFAPRSKSCKRLSESSVFGERKIKANLEHLICLSSWLDLCLLLLGLCPSWLGTESSGSMREL
jgi:hypothetical protein